MAYKLRSQTLSHECAQMVAALSLVTTNFLSRVGCKFKEGNRKQLQSKLLDVETRRGTG